MKEKLIEVYPREVIKHNPLLQLLLGTSPQRCSTD